jgi:hypothetical protein
MIKHWHRWTLLMFAILGLAARAQEQKPTPYTAMAPAQQYFMTSAQEEIALARTAAPASISADAEVLVLTASGYETAVKGSNGFVCFIERSWTAGFDDAEFWNPRIRGPNCFNPPAVRSVLPQYLRRTQWALAGDTRAQMREKARLAFASQQFAAPESGSFSFMLSKQGFLGDGAGGPWHPHVMFFIAHGQAPTWAAGLKDSPVMGDEGDAAEPTVLFIPVPRWSDGSLAPYPDKQHPH